jgi:hypothetical protein
VIGLDTVPVTAGDGRRLTLRHAVGDRPPTRGPVLLVHGAGVRANIFMAPVEVTLVDDLLGAGYDVWLANWRASIDLAPCEWTLDDAAVHDHPALVRAVLDGTGADTLQAVVHCQGSTSFVMSAVAGLLPQVTTIVSNAVSLHPVIPRISELKLRVVTPAVARITPYMNPQWGLDAPGFVPKLFRSLTRVFHHECSNDVCKMVSFTYGTGFPTLWSHDNLSPTTHEWVKREFADVPLTFFGQMGACVARGHLVSLSEHPELPRSLVADRPATDARFVLLAGEDNRCFLAESQRRTFEFLDHHAPGRHALHVVPGYGHLDMFMGSNAHRDVFPTILEELE